MQERSTLEIKFNDFGNVSSFKDVLGTDIPTDIVSAVLRAFYAYKIGVYVNDQNYEAIRTLEGVMELHNLIEGKTQ